MGQIMLTEEAIIEFSTKDCEYCDLAVETGKWAAKAQLKRVVEEIKRDGIAIHPLDGNRGVGVQLSPEFWQALLKEAPNIIEHNIRA